MPVCLFEVKKRLLKTLYNAGGFAPFHWVNRRKLLVLTYHRFSRAAEPGKVSAAAFESHLDYLKVRNTVVTLSEAIDHLQTGRPLPPNPAVITIDDGYLDAYQVAFPILRRYGLPATLYAITDFVEQRIWLWTDIMRFVLHKTEREEVIADFGAGDRVQARLGSDAERLSAAGRINDRLKRLPEKEKQRKIREIAEDLDVEIPELPPRGYSAMSWDQACEMDTNGIAIESHTVTHPILTNVSDAELSFEMKVSKKRLEERLDRAVDHFCYPNGSFDPRVRRAAEAAGYTSAVTTEYGFNSGPADLLLLNRIDAQSAIESFAQSASGLEALRHRVFAARVA